MNLLAVDRVCRECGARFRVPYPSDVKNFCTPSCRNRHVRRISPPDQSRANSPAARAKKAKSVSGARHPQYGRRGPLGTMYGRRGPLAPNWKGLTTDERRERFRLAQELRRHRIRANGGTHTRAEWLEKVELLGECCVYCGRSDLPLTEDHKVPLSRGGSDAIENVVPACAPCNFRKRDRTAAEFLCAS